jgi:hypothetical protein
LADRRGDITVDCLSGQAPRSMRTMFIHPRLPQRRSHKADAAPDINDEIGCAVRSARENGMASRLKVYLAGPDVSAGCGLDWPAKEGTLLHTMASRALPLR